MTDKHTVHLKEGGKVVIDGDNVELHLPGPLVFHRKHWIVYLLPREEASRAVSYGSLQSNIEKMLAEAFTAVPMTVYRERDDG